MNTHFFLKPFYCLDPESSHQLALDLLQRIKPFSFFLPPPILCPQEVMGLRFPNPVGLAAGFDKDGRYVDALFKLGFGFIEIGTLTPKPQLGNPKPRLFRIEEEQAIINCMGFNNRGIDAAITELEKKCFPGILGISIGKNKDTPLEEAISDYRYGLEKAYKIADYIAINISSPNTLGLRSLQEEGYLHSFLAELKKTQQMLSTKHQKYTPLAVKVSPDLSANDLQHFARLALDFGIDGIIATNTTIDRPFPKGHRAHTLNGGLSGAPLRQKSEHTLVFLSQCLQGKIPIIATGGMMTPKDAKRRLALGASLVQLYSGLVFYGPMLPRDCAKCLVK
jgi:dihydroorotate dehydrogenase